MRTISSLAALALALVALAPASHAKGHDQGFGAGTAGQATAGAVDDGQSNREGRSPETSYGRSDASIEAKDGTSGKSDAAQDRSAPGHPSNN